MSSDDDNDSPIEDKKKPSGNFVSDMIWATVYVILAAYGSSSFIYMLHISKEETRKFKETDEDIRTGKNTEYSVLSGSYMYGPPYLPNNKNTIDMRKKTVPNQKDYSDKNLTNDKLEEQKHAIDISSMDSVAMSNEITGLWSKNCPKKLDKYGKKVADYTHNSKSDSLHDWLYSNSTFCNPSNLNNQAYDDEGNTHFDVTKKITKRLINFFMSLVVDNNPEGLSENQLAYRQKLGYNIYKYIFFIIVGTMAFTRNLMNKILQFLSFDSNEFKYWKDPKKNEFERNEDKPDNYANSDTKQRHILRKQLIITLLFALLGKLIYGLTFTAGLFIGGFSSIIFAFWNWNFISMLTWWSASLEQGPVMWVIYSIISLLLWILGIYLMFVLPGFIGHIMAFIIPAVILGTLFVYPFYDNTTVFVKNPNAGAYFKGNYAVKSASKPNPIESDAKYNSKTTQCQYPPSVPGMDPIIAENVSRGNDQFTKGKDDDGNDPGAQYKLDKETCYENFVQKLSGSKYINHLVKKNMSLWMTLILHDLLRLIDADTTTHELFGQNITLLGDPSSSWSINMGTIPLFAVTAYKLLSIIRNK
uniref:Uncharacterized protein n=1 Tax=viral metagenome TaxID=1070528 RepID=A0A6C0AXK3_9ZZZZ|tara:strand:- start:21409 stop:23166 length:1758 start_codon:yes stop_codon:yes gene_type:complete